MRLLRTLRGQVLLGAVLWTFGLMALWATAITFHPERFRFVLAVHRSPHGLMLAAGLCMAAGYAVALVVETRVTLRRLGRASK